SQLSADPIQRIETRAAADVFAIHLADHSFGVGVDVQLAGSQLHSALQSLEQSHILSHVVVLTSYPLGNSDGWKLCTIKHDANSRRSRVSPGTAIHVRDKIRHRILFPCNQHALDAAQRQDALLVLTSAAAREGFIGCE